MKSFLTGILFVTLSIAQAQTAMSLSALKDSISSIMDKNHIPGLMISLVDKDSIIWAGGIGVANRQKNTPVTETTLFRIGSISKSFTALAVLKLIEEKKFTLQSTLAELAPEIPFQNPWEKEAPVRVINLLEHTAGFDDMHFANFSNEEGKSKTTLNQALAHVKAMHSRWKPGTRMAYSNPGYAILGYVVEKYSGIKYEDYVRQNIFKPVGMNHSNFDYDLNEPYATGYSYSGGKYHEALPVSINGNAAGAISSCATDMANYVRLYLNEGIADTTHVFAPGIIHEMEFTHSTLAAKGGLPTGYGLANYSKMIGNNVKEYFRGHNGGINGFSSDFGYSRQWGVGYAVSNNGEAGNNKIVTKIVEYLLQGRSSTIPAAKRLNMEVVDEFEGTYLLKSNRNQIFALVEDLFATSSLFLKNDTLYYQQFLGEAEPWIPVSDYQFRKKNELVPTALLTKDGDMKVIFSGFDYMAKVSPARIWALRIAIGLSLVLGLLLAPFTIVWVVMTALKKITGRDLLARIVPMLAFLSFTLMLLTFVDLVDLNNIITSAKINWRTLSIFLFGLLLPVLAVISIYIAIKRFKTTRSGFIKYFVLFSSLGAGVLSIYLLEYGWIGLRLWEY